MQGALSWDSVSDRNVRFMCLHSFLKVKVLRLTSTIRKKNGIANF